MSLFQISITEQSIICNTYACMLYSCLALMQPFVAFSAFAGMTIPYPKREFLNDDDSDSKSSAAKVMECYWVNLHVSITHIPHLHYIDPTSDWQNNGLNSAFDQVLQSVCKRYVN